MDEVTKAIVQAFREAPYNADDKNIDHALQDTNLPEFVRKGIEQLDSDATTKLELIREGKMTWIYARYNGEPCKVTIVSRMGDIGISYYERDMGYNTRGLSIYDLTDFSETPHWKK